RFFLELQATELPGQHAVNRALVELAERLGVHTVATGNVHYAVREQHPVHDVLRCIAAGVTVNDPHPARPFNDQLHMIPPEEMARRFAWHPQAVANAAAIAEQCRPALVLGKSRHPRFTLRDEHGREKPVDANALLERLAWDGARRRYGKISHALRRRIEEELAIIRQLDMADYFLVAWDVVQYANSGAFAPAGGVPRPTRSSPTAWASPTWTRSSGGSASSGLCPSSGASRRTSTSTSKRTGGTKWRPTYSNATAKTASPAWPPTIRTTPKAPSGR